jgi:hypothetical protein
MTARANSLFRRVRRPRARRRPSEPWPALERVVPALRGWPVDHTFAPARPRR